MILTLISYSQSHIVELSESRSDGISEQRLSGKARRGFTRKEVTNAPVSHPNKALL